MPRKKIAPIIPQEKNGQYCFARVLPDSLPPPSTTYRECPECGEVFSIAKCGMRDGRKCCVDCGQCQCQECEKYGDREDMEEIGDEWYCDDCHCHCEACETAYPNESDDLVRAYSSYNRRYEYSYCEDCTFKCADCDKRFAESLEEHNNPSDDRICERCRDNYYTCDECGCMMSGDDTHNTNDHTYCASCYEDHAGEEDEDNEDEDDNRRVHSHGYKPDAVFMRHEGQKQTDLYFGLELEVDRSYRSNSGRNADIDSADIPDAFYCKEDGSLSNGFEVVSHPATYEWFANHKWEWADTLRKSGYRSYDTDTCGIHIHVSKRALSSLDILKLLEFFKLNPQFIHFVSRRKAHLLNQWSRINEYGRKGQISKIRGQMDDERYEAINLLNRHTIEFRIFKGTLNRVSILRNVGFVRTLIAYVKQNALGDMTSKAYRAWLQENAAKVLGRGEVAKSLVKWLNKFETVGALTDADIRHRIGGDFADIAA